jgi:squalene-hopene/tetraprenyl-beta-curcumene cyclase
MRLNKKFLSYFFLIIMNLCVFAFTVETHGKVYNYDVPYISQIDYPEWGQSACGPTSIAMILKYWYPNSLIDVPEVYHAATQDNKYYKDGNTGAPLPGYYNVGYATHVWQGTVPDTKTDRVPEKFREFHKGDYSGMSSEYAVTYLKNIWDGLVSKKSQTMENIINEIIYRPVILNVNEGWGGHFVVLRGYNDEENSFYINDPYPPYADGGAGPFDTTTTSANNRKIDSEKLSEWVSGRKMITFQLDSDEVDPYTVIVDNGIANWGDEGILNSNCNGQSHCFQVDNINAMNDDGYIWLNYHTSGMDWIYPTEAGHFVRWTPRFTKHGYYELFAKFFGDLTQSAVQYDIHNSSGIIVDTCSVDQSTSGYQSVSLGQYKLGNGAYVEVADMPAYCNADTIMFKYIGEIPKALNWLRDQQLANGSWSNEPAITSLAVLAMLNWGYDENDSFVYAGIDYLLNTIKVNDDGSFHNESGRYTYYTSIAILPLIATRNNEYKDEIVKMRDWLIGSQWDENSFYADIDTDNINYGGFGYGNGTRADLSNTQWALMGIKAADEYLGLNANDTDQTYDKAAQYFLERCQNADGGSSYTPNGLSIHTMTAASVWSYLLCGVGPGGAPVDNGLEWLEENYSLISNDGSGRISDYYYALTFAKALTMSHKTKLGDIGGHDWFEELSEQLMNWQTEDGNWPGGGWLSGQADLELTTCYSILSLQTRTLTPHADLSMSIILESHADVHVYDPHGRHMGVNYDTMTIEENIPGATFKILDADGNEVPYDGTTPDEGLRQVITLPVDTAGSYRVELVGTSDGPFDLTINGEQDGKIVTTRTYDGEIHSGENLATTVTVTAMEGAMTLLYESLDVLPIMEVTPSQAHLSVEPGTAQGFPFTVREVGGQETLHSVSIYCTDITGPASQISGSDVTFGINNFDVAAGGSQIVNANIPIPADFKGSSTGSIIIESSDGGTKAIALTIEKPFISLIPGWNLISLCKQPADISIDSVLKGIEGKYSSLWSFQNNSWKVYDPHHPGFSDLSTMEAGWGYWINMMEAATLTVGGAEPSKSIDLIRGWNLVGYNSCTSQSIDSALALIDGKYISVWAYINGQWRVYDPANPGFSDLYNMDPGYGYWIKAKQNCSWTLP